MEDDAGTVANTISYSTGWDLSGLDAFTCLHFLGHIPALCSQTGF